MRADDEIVTAAKAGDAAAWAELYRAHAGRLQLWLEARSGATFESPEDLAAASWMVAAERIADFTGSSSDFGGWLFGIARNHPFVDGNKRTAWILARLFLALNDMQLRYDKGEAVGIILSLAAGEVSEEELGAWFRERIVAVSGAGRGGKE